MNSPVADVPSDEVVAEVCQPPGDRRYVIAELVSATPSRPVRPIFVLLAVAALGAIATATRILFAALPEASSDPKPDEAEVTTVRDLAYVEGDEADAKKHKLDLYLPKGKQDFPVVLFVHGGAWTSGDRNFFGAYEAVGKMFARHGIGAVVISYRLSPSVKHPEHIKDVARAFAWTKHHIAEYGGLPDRLFVCGHSAGGHLTALLATDESYLKTVGCSFDDVCGAMPISGVYSVPENFFKKVFGEDAEVRKNASPRHQVRAGCPPFLILYAAKDFPFCDKASEDFAKALRDNNVMADTLKVDDRNHINIITRTPNAGDPCGKALLDFVAKHATDAVAP